MNDTASLKATIEESEAKLRELSRAIKNLIDTVETHPSPDLVGRLRQRETERNTEQVKLERLKLRLKQSIAIDAGW
ncbi:MAG: hypothetical protein HC875_22650 [Anaerolineales bacterium]|nr:hypothetical protein [Anaerolineales bacterium]